MVPSSSAVSGLSTTSRMPAARARSSSSSRTSPMVRMTGISGTNPHHLAAASTPADECVKPFWRTPIIWADDLLR